MTACSVPGRRDVLFVKRHAGEREIVRMRASGKSATFTVVATLAAPISRDPSDTGGNASFDHGWFDASRSRCDVTTTPTTVRALRSI